MFLPGYIEPNAAVIFATVITKGAVVRSMHATIFVAFNYLSEPASVNTGQAVISEDFLLL